MAICDPEIIEAMGRVNPVIQLVTAERTGGFCVMEVMGDI